MTRARLIEKKLRESLELFNDHPNFGFRRTRGLDRRRNSYQLAAEIGAALATPRWWESALDRFGQGLVAGAITVPFFFWLLYVLPTTPVPQ